MQVPFLGGEDPLDLSELHPVNEVNTKGQFFRASFGKNPRFQIQLDKRPLSPGQVILCTNNHDCIFIIFYFHTNCNNL